MITESALKRVYMDLPSRMVDQGKQIAYGKGQSFKGLVQVLLTDYITKEKEKKHGKKKRRSK